ncbi:MAG: carbamoyl-phosphate synthase L chain, partial [Vulcanococcus sp.]
MAAIKRHLSIAGVTALALASVPAVAEPSKVAQARATDLGVMSVSLKDAVKLNYGLQGQLQGAGTPNEAGIGGFFPLRVGTQSVTFLDVLANVNFADYPGYSSIINTTVAGGTISTSTRLGQRWLNGDRSWMYGVNVGYDSRPMATGPADTGVNVSNSQTVFFQQLALNAEAVSDKWSALGYW